MKFIEKNSILEKRQVGAGSSAELQKNILSTVAYYDAMDYPMTSFEVWKYLTRVANGVDKEDNIFSLSDVIIELGSDRIKRFVEEYRGFYFLKGRNYLVEKRLEKNKIANNKLKIALGVAKWLRFVPFVRMIAVTGSLAMKNTESLSDLDLLIVLKHGKIFTGRTLVTGMVHLLGRRRHGDKIANRICLNYFITTESLEINLKDLFSASEYSFIFPIFGWHNFQKFQKANEWMKKYKPNFHPDEISNLRFLKEAFLTYRSRLVGEAFLSFNFIEEFLKKWQTERIARDPRTHKTGSMVVANEEMLVFLPEPQGPQVFEKFKKRLGSLV
ncbi:MAG: hypothetical protein WCX17_01895 [Parcubacteria group bacterium]|jgi:predicted nucleotidyltransferase